MPLAPGAKLGHYEILAPIGAGGMGEVYKAHDPRVGRDVAIKISDQRFSERFEREARAVAQLNHANICTLYDVGPNYLVMELVDGAPLKGPLPLDQAIKYGAQICEALAAAHAKGITHRDLKPANIMATKAGIKLLDFGLARIAASADQPTLTIVGSVMGTPAYMSPEQWEGKPGDARSDIYAFGCVLHEMLTGKRLAEGRVPVEPRVEGLLAKCLEKDPEERWQSARDLRIALELAVVPVGPEPKPSAAGIWWKAAVALSAIAALALGYVSFRHVNEEPPRILTFTVPPPEKAAFGQSLAVSPNGHRITFTSGNQLWVRDLETLAARALAGTEGATYPFWSPDNRYLGFFAGGKMKKIDVSGGPALTICDVAGARGGTWNKNDVIVFAPGTGTELFRVAAAGGQATPVTTLDKETQDNAHRRPWFLPDGRHFVYTARSNDPEKSAIYVGDLESKSRKVVVRARMPCTPRRDTCCLCADEF